MPSLSIASSGCGVDLNKYGEINSLICPFVLEGLNFRCRLQSLYSILLLLENLCSSSFFSNSSSNLTILSANDFAAFSTNLGLLSISFSICSLFSMYFWKAAATFLF